MRSAARWTRTGKTSDHDDGGGGGGGGNGKGFGEGVVVGGEGGEGGEVGGCLHRREGHSRLLRRAGVRMPPAAQVSQHRGRGIPRVGV